MKIRVPKFHNLKKVVIRKAPDILAFVGTVGMIAGTVLAVKATPKALKLIDEKKAAEEKDKLTPIETIQTTWKCYIPSASVIIFSSISILSGNNIHAKRNAALATACSLSTKTLMEYKNAVKEVVGEKKADAIQNKVAESQIKSNPIKNNEVIITKNDSHLCYDSISGRYFKSDIETIKRAINELNRNMVQEMYISLNEFYSMIGLSSVSIGDNIGWNIDDGFIEVEFSSLIADDGTPCIVLSSDIAPRWDYRDLA